MHRSRPGKCCDRHRLHPGESRLHKFARRLSSGSYRESTAPGFLGCSDGRCTEARARGKHAACELMSPLNSLCKTGISGALQELSVARHVRLATLTARGCLDAPDRGNSLRLRIRTCFELPPWCLFLNNFASIVTYWQQRRQAGNAEVKSPLSSVTRTAPVRGLVTATTVINRLPYSAIEWKSRAVGHAIRGKAADDMQMPVPAVVSAVDSCQQYDLAPHSRQCSATQGLGRI